MLRCEDQHKSRDPNDKDEPQQIASADIYTSGSEIYAKAESADMYKSVDLLTAKLKKQLKKHKDKYNGHN